MSKLVSAGFSRLKKDKTFWLCIGTMLVYAVIYMLSAGADAARDLSQYQYSLDEYYFHFAFTIGLFCAVFSSIFLGTEYSDGTLRNKIAAGHTRSSIYLSSFILVFLATLLMMAVWLFGAFIGIPALGLWKMSPFYLALYLLTAVLMTSALSALFTFVGMLSSSKAATAIFSILLFLGLLLFASTIYNCLHAPETLSNVVMTADGMEIGDPTPNPGYISGITRTIYQFILDFVPTGQGLQMWMLEIAHPVRMLASSACITLTTIWGGICLFKKKNLN